MLLDSDQCYRALVTHDARAAERARTVLHLEKGILVERQAVASA